MHRCSAVLSFDRFGPDARPTCWTLTALELVRRRKPRFGSAATQMSVLVYTGVCARICALISQSPTRQLNAPRHVTAHRHLHSIPAAVCVLGCVSVRARAHVVARVHLHLREAAPEE